MNLDELWTRISDFLEPHGLVFPTAPDSDGGCPTAVWPHDDPTGFLEFATTAEPQVFYARRIVVDDDVAARLLDDFTGDEMLDVRDAPGEDDEPTRDTAQLRAAVDAHRNETVSVELGFFVGPAYHVYVQTAEWANDLSALGEQRRVEDSAHSREDWAARRLEADQAREDAAPKQREWAELLCEDNAFIGAINDTGRHAAAAEAIPEMASHLDSPRHVEDDARRRALRLAAWAAVREASEAVRSRVRPEREKEALSDLDALVAVLIAVPTWASATTKTQQRGIVRDFLKDRFGFTTSASLTESVVEAARRQREG